LLGLSSDSSLRFERGVDVASVRRASDRATYLILQSCGGFLGEITHAGSDEVKPIQIPVRLPRITQLLDVEVGKDEVATLLKPLGFDVAGGASNSIEVSVPSFRQRDVAREIDVIEEVCRLYGYDKIPASMPRTTGAPRVPDPTEAIAREALSACGLNETCISSLTGPDATESHSGNGSSTAISVLNPLSEDHQILRQSLLPGLVKAAAYNQDRGRKDVWLFEIGRAYHRQGNPTSREAAVREDLRVAGVICGTRDRSRWQQAARSEQTDVYAAKGVVENLLERLSIDCDSVSFDSESTKAPGWFHPARCSQIMVTAGKKAQPVAVGWLGELHPAQADREGLRNQLYIFELSLDELRALRKAQSFEEIHNTPMVSRDLTVDVSADIEQQKVYETLRRAAGSFLRSLEMVSIFDLSDREKSLSYRLTFQNPDDTLTNEQLEEILTKIRESLKSNIGGSFRA
jgi:phenylalanyl-tRNA synthetase beta chain